MKVTNLGDHELRNTVTSANCDDVECAPAPVVTNLPYVVPKKTSDADPQSPPGPGDKVTYELSWTNTGLASGKVDSTDDLSEVLDDATLTTPPTSDDDGIETDVNAGALFVTGPIDPGQTVTVTYTVTIKPYGERGDSVLTNSVVADDPQVTCDDSGDCTPVDPPRTNTVLGDLHDWKTVDPASGTTIRSGDTATYTLHFHNTGGSPVDVARVDDLTEVLDDADLIDGPTVSDDALTATRTGARVVVNGTLAAGAEETVTYTVRVQRMAETIDWSTISSTPTRSALTPASPRRRGAGLHGEPPVRRRGEQGLQRRRQGHRRRPRHVHADLHEQVDGQLGAARARSTTRTT